MLVTVDETAVAQNAAPGKAAVVVDLPAGFNAVDHESGRAGSYGEKPLRHIVGFAVANWVAGAGGVNVDSGTDAVGDDEVVAARRTVEGGKAGLFGHELVVLPDIDPQFGINVWVDERVAIDVGETGFLDPIAACDPIGGVDDRMST